MHANGRTTSGLVQLGEWFGQVPGSLLLEEGRHLLETELSDCFGRTVLHSGVQTPLQLPEGMRELIRLGPPLPGVELVCSEAEWPVREHAVDVVVLQHALEAAVSPHRLLREAARCVRPGGHLLVLAIQPWSLWGVCRLMADRNGPVLSAARLTDWLSLLGFAVENRRLGCYCPPFSTPALRRSCDTLLGHAERLQLPGAGLYLLRARKLMIGLRPLPGRSRSLNVSLPAVPVASVAHEPASNRLGTEHE